MVHTECDVKKDVSLAIMGPNVILSLDFVNVYPDGWANSVELVSKQKRMDIWREKRSK